MITGDIINDQEIDRCSSYRKIYTECFGIKWKYVWQKEKQTILQMHSNDKSLLVFLVPFEDKNTSFSKRKLNRFVSFKFINWDSKHPEGQLIETIGYVSEIDAYCEYMLRCKDISHPIQKFSKDTFKAIAKHSTDISDVLKNKKYLDRRHEYVMSIDPSGCEDIDDAFSCKQNKDGTVTLSIYIANVPVWLDYLGLWNHIGARVSTIYLPDRERPMLPPALSSGLCSLKSGTDKITLCLDVVVQAGLVKETNFNVAIVNLSKNFAYEDHELSNARGYSLAMSTVDALNHKTQLLDDIIDSHDLVQYMMLLMNVEAANRLSELNDGIFRSLTLKSDKQPSSTCREI